MWYQESKENKKKDNRVVLLPKKLLKPSVMPEMVDLTRNIVVILMKYLNYNTTNKQSINQGMSDQVFQKLRTSTRFL